MNELFVLKTLQEKQNVLVIQCPPPKCKSKSCLLIDEVLDVCHFRYKVGIALVTANR